MIYIQFLAISKKRHCRTVSNERSRPHPHPGITQKAQNRDNSGEELCHNNPENRAQ